MIKKKNLIISRIIIAVQHKKQKINLNSKNFKGINIYNSIIFKKTPTVLFLKTKFKTLFIDKQFNK